MYSLLGKREGGVAITGNIFVWCYHIRYNFSKQISYTRYPKWKTSYTFLLEQLLLSFCPLYWSSVKQFPYFLLEVRSTFHFLVPAPWRSGLSNVHRGHMGETLKTLARGDRLHFGGRAEVACQIDREERAGESLKGEVLAFKQTRQCTEWGKKKTEKEYWGKRDSVL